VGEDTEVESSENNRVENAQGEKDSRNRKIPTDRKKAYQKNPRPASQEGGNEALR